jgi:uncharacterized protein YgiM (DUF1202 family)
MRNIFMLGSISVLLLGCVATAGDLSTTTAAPSSAENRWVVGAGTSLKSEATATSADIAPLEVGAQVVVLENAGRWLKVQTAGQKTGWVFAGRLSSTPPVAEVAASEGLFSSSAQRSQIEVARADSARSVRGLSAETENYAKERGTPQEYRKALDQILARQVSKEEVKAFMRAGKLGEYAQ